MIKLRAIEPEDLDILFKIENDTEQWKISTNNMPYSRQFLLDYILSTTGDIYADKQLRLVIESSQSSTPVGIIDLSNYSPAHNRAEIGITILPEHRNKGYAQEALKQLEQYSKSILHLHQLYAIIPQDNNASIRLFQKCGFSSQSTLKDWLFDGTEYQNAEVMQKSL